MLESSFDLETRTAIMRMSGPHDFDRDFPAYLDAVDQALAAGRGDVGLIVLVDRDYPPPPANWRAVIATRTAHVGEGCHFVLVSQSRVTRAAVTAINWVRKPRYHHHVCETLEEAIAWLGAKRGVPPGWTRAHPLLSQLPT